MLPAVRSTLIAAMILLAACGGGDALDAALRRDAGAGAIDCGRAEHGDERADRCVAEAFTARRAFRVRYHEQEPFASAKASAAAGAVYFYSLDGRSGRITRFTCSKPQLETHGDHRHLVCMSCLECTGKTP